MKVYSVAIMDTIVPAAYCKTTQSTGVKIQDLLRNALIADETISPSGDERFAIFAE